jgi:hypothetical protein
MAQWKKIVVSGSDISQLNNDKLYVTASGGGQVNLEGSFSGSFEGNGSNITNIQFTNIVNQPTIFSGSVQTDITQTTGYTAFSSSISTTVTTLESTLNSNISSVSSSLASDLTTLESTLDGNISSVSSSLASDLTALEDQTITGGSGISTSGTLGTGITVDTNVDDTTIEVNGSDNLAVKASSIGATQLDQVFTDNGGVAGDFGSSTQVPVLSIDEQGRITSASLSTISTTLSISGDSGTDSVSLIDGTLDFQGTNGVTTTVTDDKVTFALNNGVVSGSTFSSPNQGTLRTVTNGVQNDIDLGLQTTDNVTFNTLTVAGDTTVNGNLTVNGDLTSLNTTNKAITDKFILLNSGSTNPDEGGIVIDEGSGTGHAFIFDGDDGRWGVVQSLSSAVTTANSEAYVSLVVNENDVDHDVNDVEYQKVGNIKVDTTGNIYIYT